MNEFASDRTRNVPPPRTWTHLLARWCILPLVHSPVTPNHLTTLRLLTGLGAAAAFAAGERDWILMASLLFIVSTLLDRADGELARLSGRISASGHRYDLACDLGTNAAVFIGIGIGLASGPLGLGAVVMGIAAGISVAAIFLVVFRLHDYGSNPQEAFGAAPGFDLDDGLFLLAPVAWLDLLQPALIAAAIGAPLFLVYAVLRYRDVRALRDQPR